MLQTCEYCMETFEVYDSKRQYPRVNYRYYGYCSLPARDVVYFTTDPFNEEIRGDETLHWICWQCHQDSEYEI